MLLFWDLAPPGVLYNIVATRKRIYIYYTNLLMNETNSNSMKERRVKTYECTLFILYTINVVCKIHKGMVLPDPLCINIRGE